MGMFDSVYLDAEAAKLVRCVHEHPQEMAELQTKSLDSTGTHYYVVKVQLYRQAPWIPGRAIGVIEPYGPEGSFYLVDRTLLLKSDLTATIRGYTHCHQCLAVVYDTGREDMWTGSLDSRRPWLEWELIFTYGVLQETRPIKLESRDEVKAGLERRGLRVLDDQDPLATRYRAQHRS